MIAGQTNQVLSIAEKRFRETTENRNDCLNQSINFEVMYPMHFKLLKEMVPNVGGDKYKYI